MRVHKNGIHLKNNLAQSLLNKKVVEIDGVKLNLWTGHSKRSIITQNTWNKIKSYTALNSKVTKKIGSVVFTGIMQIPRNEAAIYAIGLGFQVHNNISNKTDYIVVGTENVSPSKIARSIELNAKGANIHLVDEIAFLHLVEDNFDLIETVSIELSYTDMNHYSNNDVVNENLNNVISDYGEVYDELDTESFPDLLQGQSFVVSGKFTVSRDEIKQKISNFGGKVISAISSKTDYVLAGDKMGPAKLKKAEKLEINIISEDDFYKLINI